MPLEELSEEQADRLASLINDPHEATCDRERALERLRNSTAQGLVWPDYGEPWLIQRDGKLPDGRRPGTVHIMSVKDYYHARKCLDRANEIMAEQQARAFLRDRECFDRVLAEQQQKAAEGSK